MAINNSGLADPSDYVLGRGVVQIAKLDASGNPGPFRDLGNAPLFSLTGAAQTIEHQSSRHSLALVDRKIVTSQALSCAFELDEIQNFENLADWLLGTADTVTNGAIAGNSAPVAIAPDGAGETDKWLGRHYLLRNDSGNRAYSVQSADLALITTQTVPVALVQGTDYTLDSENGSVFIKADSSRLATAAAANKGFTVKLTAHGADADVPAAVDRVRAFKSASLEVAIRFILENAADDANQSELICPKVTLASDGDLALIGKDFAAMKFSGSLSPGDVGSVYAGEYVVIVDGATGF